MSKPDTIPVHQVAEVPATATRRDFVRSAMVSAATVGLIVYQPLRASGASEVGTLIKGRGIYHGAWQPRPIGVIVHAYSDKGAEIVAAMDADDAGRELADLIENVFGRCGRDDLAFRREEPIGAKDWNDLLRARKPPSVCSAFEEFIATGCVFLDE